MSRWLLPLILLLAACGSPSPRGGGISQRGDAQILDRGTLSEAGAEDGASMDGASRDGAAPDGGVLPSDAGVAPLCPPALDLGRPSHCTIAADQVSCSLQQLELRGRTVYFQTPLGAPPANGWPAVVIFQGSFFGPAETQSGGPGLPFGGFYQVQLQALLLNHGFAIIAPEAQAGLAWTTNFPGYEGSDDHQQVLAILAELRPNGRFGPIDSGRLYATGISSGGYMTSRMAVTYPGRFRALAINAGSYATCTNILCSIPDPLPRDHPPTLFLHGARDLTVPMYTAEAYRDQLEAQGLETDFVVDPQAGHEWLPVAPAEIGCWFLTH